MILRLAMVQMNAVVGDVKNNMRAICGWIREAKKAKADVVVFPELAVSGYPPEDLLLMPQFLRDICQTRDRIAKATSGILAVVGSVDELDAGPLRLKKNSNPTEKKLLNVAWVFADQQLQGIYAKHKLPNYGVFDEERYFQPGTTTPVVHLGPVRIGITICEDMWFADGPARNQVRSGGAHLILNMNASPYHVGKTKSRQHMLATRAREDQVILSYTNMVGGQDELVFDGNSLVLDSKGLVLAKAKAFEEDLLLTDLQVPITKKQTTKDLRKKSKRPLREHVPQFRVEWSSPHQKSRFHLEARVTPQLEETEEIYRALLLGVRDYVRKNNFSKAVVGISGGIDSALTAAIACDALGPSQVIGVMMPSPFTSPKSRYDAKHLARNLGMSLLNLPITQLFQAYLRRLKKLFQGYPSDTTEENLQARIRGTLLMALSNKFGYLVLTTGNKSEMSVGYATLYGDMAGGFAVIKDVPKTKVYKLTQWRNKASCHDLARMSIPERIQTRAPSAELRPDQTDQDSLPEYTVLDAILQAYVEEDRSIQTIVKLGYDAKIVRKVMRLVDQAEYKRRQAPVGIKITPRALGKDRRMPITNRYTLDQSSR